MTKHQTADKFKPQAMWYDHKTYELTTTADLLEQYEQRVPGLDESGYIEAIKDAEKENRILSLFDVCIAVNGRPQSAQDVYEKDEADDISTTISTTITAGCVTIDLGRGERLYFRYLDKPDSVVQEIQELDKNEFAHKFFLWARERQNDTLNTSIKKINEKAGITQTHKKNLATMLAHTGCCKLHATHVSWNYSLKSIGEVATDDRLVSLAPLDPELLSDLNLNARNDINHKLTTIPEIKETIAKMWGIKTSGITITLRG